MSSRDWNSIPPPSSQLHITFNLSRPAATDTFNSDPVLEFLLLFTIQECTTEIVPYWCGFFLYQYKKKKKKILEWQANRRVKFVLKIISLTVGTMECSKLGEKLFSSMIVLSGSKYSK